MLLTKEKNNSNSLLVEKEYYTLNSAKEQTEIPFAQNERKVPISLIDAFILNSAFKMIDLSDFPYFVPLSQTTVIEERKSLRLSPAEAYKLSMRSLEKMKSRWEKYFEDEIKFYITDF